MLLPKSLEDCPCGKKHEQIYTEVFCDAGAVKKLPQAVMMCAANKAFVVADKNTYKAAGEAVKSILDSAEIPYTFFEFEESELKPDERCVGSVFMRFDETCDVIIGIGSGVINDTCKILSKRTERKYIIVATAPSMDGYISATSSMEAGGLKVSLPTRCADIIIGDLDILKNAPERMLVSGLGDMLAKYVSICEWRISNLVTGEYYCDRVGGLVREALAKCIRNRSGLLKRDTEAVRAVFEGLLLAGAAMNYAGASRPASGVEHYFSHVWDMRALAFGEPCDLHGIQCAVGTFYAVKMYNKLALSTPDLKKAEKAAEGFDYEDWASKLRKFIGPAAEEMIRLEQKEKKYDPVARKKRARIICENWPEIVTIIREEIPSDEEYEDILSSIGAPKRSEDIGLSKNILKMTFLATKDIRDKYVLSRLLSDLGLADEYGEELSSY